MFRAVIPVHNPVCAMDLQTYHVEHHKHPGQNVYTFRGEYEDLLKLLTDYYAMSPAEADIEIEEEPACS